MDDCDHRKDGLAGNVTSCCIRTHLRVIMFAAEGCRYSLCAHVLEFLPEGEPRGKEETRQDCRFHGASLLPFGRAFNGSNHRSHRPGRRSFRHTRWKASGHDDIVRALEAMSYCGVVEVRSLEDALGATCARSAAAQCSDCGTALCDAHAERCELCSETFCPGCVSFHRTEHPRPAQSDQFTESPRKKTA